MCRNDRQLSRQIFQNIFQCHCSDLWDVNNGSVSLDASAAFFVSVGPVVVTAVSGIDVSENSFSFLDE
jgi:hypothetical protein